MLVVINAKDVDEVKDIIGLLLINKKKGFTVYDDETDLLLSKKAAVHLPLPLPQKPIESEETPTAEDDSTSQTDNPPEDIMEEAEDILSPSPNQVSTKKRLLNWNFNYHDTPITSEMKDGSAYYFDAESSEEDEFEEENKFVATPSINKPKRGRPPKNTPTPSNLELDINICQKCKNRVRTTSLTFAELSNHALIHTDLKKYACPIANCLFKSRQRSTVAFHIANVHKMEAKKLDVPEILTSEENVRLEKITLECFPNLCNI